MSDLEIDLGFLDIECERCGARDCPFYEGSKPGEWLCDRCCDDGKDAIGRLMERENLGFIAAVEKLAGGL